MNTKKKRNRKSPRADQSKNTSLRTSNGGPPWDWGDIDHKRQAFLTIMNAIVDNPDLGQEYLESDEKAAQAFRDAGMEVPDYAKVVFLPPGDHTRLTRASAVIELPDPNKPSPTRAQLMELMVANYTIVW